MPHYANHVAIKPSCPPRYTNAIGMDSSRLHEQMALPPGSKLIAPIHETRPRWCNL
jgi:hypothetical protein